MGHVFPVGLEEVDIGKGVNLLGSKGRFIFCKCLSLYSLDSGFECEAGFGSLLDDLLDLLWSGLVERGGGVVDDFGGGEGGEGFMEDEAVVK